MTLWWTPSEVGAMEGRANQDVTDVDEEDGAADLGDPGKPVYLFRDDSGLLWMSSPAPQAVARF